jgi:hypothetical protein
MPFNHSSVSFSGLLGMHAAMASDASSVVGPTTGATLCVRRVDSAFILASYTIVLDLHPIGRLEDGETLKTEIEPGAHTICGRSFLSFSPPLQFSSGTQTLVIECGYTGSSVARAFRLRRTMADVSFRLAETSTDHDGS